MSKENWKAVVGYEGLYEVSNHGRVKSMARFVRCHKDSRRRIRERILTPYSGRLGRCLVTLCDKLTNRRTRRVHRLVLEAFIGPCPKGMECCHADGNPANNRLENLRWDIHQSNIDDKKVHNTMTRGTLQVHAKLDDDKIREIRRRAKTERQCDLADEFGVTRSTLCSAVNLQTWKHVK